MFKYIKKTISLCLVTSIIVMFGGFFNPNQVSAEDASLEMPDNHGACELVVNAHDHQATDSFNQQMPCCVADGSAPSEIFSTAAQESITNALPVTTTKLIAPKSGTDIKHEPSQTSFSAVLITISKTILRI